MNEECLIGGSIGTAISGSAIAISTNEVTTWLSIGCTILGLLITIVTSIVIPLCQKKTITAEDAAKVKQELDKAKQDLEDKGKNG